MKNLKITSGYIAKDDRMCCCMSCLFNEKHR